MILSVSKEVCQPMLELLRKESIDFEEVLFADKEMPVDEFLKEL